MRGRALPFAAIAIVVACATLPVEARSARTQTSRSEPRGRRESQPKPLPCGDMLSFAVLLDRQGFSPGQIDGSATRNFSRALAALRVARNIIVSGPPDCETWQALGGDTAEPAVTTYLVTDADLEVPFAEDIPEQLTEQADLPALEYRSPLERIAERFHASPALLQKLNPGLSIAAGAEINVPAVQPFDPETKPAPDPQAADVSVDVSRDESALRVTRPDGTLIFFAPVTTGSRYDPLPPGQWKVTSVNWRPEFHYNPDLFWDAQPGDWKATIQAGPNNPVGVVWIGLDLEHYGLHGTPEPGQVGRTASHGCVRLTNWDAARLAALVRPGTPVSFR
jgi:lipoprotein-anchoring transpeptidase ErfK/SrfK